MDASERIEVNRRFAGCDHHYDRGKTPSDRRKP